MRKLLVAAAIGLAGLAAPVVAAAATPPPSAADFARIPALSSLSLSPDGKHIAGLLSRDGKEVVLAIWKTDALNQTPFLAKTSPDVRPMSVTFAKNDRIVVTTRRTFNLGTTATHLFKLHAFDLQGRGIPLVNTSGRMSEDEKFVEQLSSPTILSTLPRDPQNILIINNTLGNSGDVYKVNLYTGARERVLRGSDRFSGYQVDLKGEVRARQELDYENGNVFIQQWIKHPDTGAWERHFRWFAKDREPVGIVGFTRDPNVAFVGTNQGKDKTAIYEYDIRNRKIGETAFEHRLFDAADVVQSSAEADYGEPLGFVYGADRTRVYWADPKLDALAKGLRQALRVKVASLDWQDPGSTLKSKIQVGDGADVDIVDWSDDRRIALVEKSGPKQPPEYYLLREGGKLQSLGGSNPSIKPDALGDGRLVQYPARDGLMIPAFLTTPPKDVYGAGPYPAIILPHGGPWSRDDLGWDISGWTQYFASRGYAVLQPQFRGSQGWGQKLWRAGDAEWGQKMQDDKDDGAKWLISQKIAAPDRIAMHGYSYGGYSAFAAAVRPNGLYQCAIAGAGVAELGTFQRETRENRFVREFQNPTIKGLSPLEQAARVSIPMLIYHGDRDQTVPISQSERFVARLKAANKPHKYVELKDMGHGYVTWNPEHTEKVLVEVEQFLKTDCGPGGL